MLEKKIGDSEAGFDLFFYYNSVFKYYSYKDPIQSAYIDLNKKKSKHFSIKYDLLFYY